MISITVLTKNSEETISKTLESLKSFPEVIMLDTGSSDRTVELAKKYPNVIVHQSPFIGFGPTHNVASQLGTHDWILSIDSDEVLSEELIEEIQSLNLEINTVYSISRANYFNEKRITFCSGWHPDRVVRLYNRKSTSFSEDAVHEKVLSKDLKEIRLEGALIHTPYRSISDFLGKMQTYSTLFAEQNKEKKKGSLFKAIFHGIAAFLKSYILKKGFLGRGEGFIISLYNGHTAFYKYLKLYFIQKKD